MSTLSNTWLCLHFMQLSEWMNVHECLSQVISRVVCVGKMAEINMEQIVNDLKNVEEAAEEVLSSKQEIVDLNVRINKNREALSAIKRDKDCDKDTNKLWLSFGNSFIKTKVGSAKHLINEDQKDLNKKVNQLRDELKPKVDKLNQLEGKECLKGFDLKALDSQEMKAMKDLL